MRRTIACLALIGASLLWPGETYAQDNPFSSCTTSQVRFVGNRPEPIADRPGATRNTLTGPVEIVCDDMVLFADQIVHESDTNMIFATGNVTLEQPDLRIFAERADIDGRTKLGTFHNAVGTARIGDTPADRNLFGTQEPDVMFRGEQIARTAPTTYTIRNGGFTTCVQPSPRWEMSGANGTVKLDRYALLRHVVLRVKDVPLLYLPAIYYPINKEDRATGFLLPTYGSSTSRGASISNAFFWAIGRSHDATIYHDWFTRSGYGVGGEYRYAASPGSEGRMTFYRGNQRFPDASGGIDADVPAKQWYQLDGNVNQSLPGGFRLIGNANYFTDIAAAQASQNIATYSQRQRAMRVSVSGTIGRLRIAALADQQDFFYGTQAGNRTGRLPSVNISMSERPIAGSRIYYGASGEAAYLLRQNDLSKPETNTSLWRFDGGPSIRAPLSSLPWLTATGTASWRITRWQESLDTTTGTTVGIPITRQIFDVGARFVGPVVARVFQTPDNGYANGFKHLIEPSFSVNRTMPFLENTTFDRIVKNDYSVDNQIGGSTRVNYRLTNRLLARRPSPGAAPGSLGVAREILSVDVSQSYYTDARMAQSDTQYQANAVPGTSKFSPVQVTAVTRPTDGTSGQFRTEFDPVFKKMQSLSASGSVHATLVDVTAGWSKRLVIDGHPYFTEGNARHFLDSAVTIRTQGNRVGGTYSFYFDAKNTAFLDQRVIVYLNGQCCGVSFDWQQVSMPLLGIPSDRRFGISFTLAGIGSFSNPLGSFGGGR